jgi:hypothetical protein
MPAIRVSQLSALPAFSQQKLRELGAPEDFTRLYSDHGSRWIFAGCLTAAVVIGALVCIGLWTVLKWITG